MSFYNYVVPKVSTKLDQGHIAAESLFSIIQNHDGSESYHSVFDMEDRQSFTGYRGPHRLAMGWFVLDFDASKVSGDPNNFNLDDAKNELQTVWSNLQLSQHFARIFFSGQKGFHLYIREEFFNVPVSENTSKIYAQVTSDLKKSLKLTTIDESIMVANHKFRLPRSKHPRSGLYKTQLPLVEFQRLDLAEILEMAKSQSSVDFNYQSNFSERHVSEPTPFTATYSTTVYGLSDFGMDTVADEDVSSGKLFKEYPSKVCISRMWEAKLNEGERHGVAAILISDLFHIGVDEKRAIEKLEAWATLQGIDSQRFERDFLRMISEQWSGSRDYSFGCYHNIKKKFCSGTCALYVKLQKGKRAEVLDVPAKVEKVLEQQDAPGERKIALEVLNSFEGKIVKQDKDLFLYCGTHWVEASQRQIDHIKELLFVRLGKRAKSKDMKSAFETFVHRVPAVPPQVNMYELNPNAANFKNGTLWVMRDKGEYTLQFRQHSQDDFLTTCLDVDYTPHTGSVNTKFNEYLEHLLAGDPELDEKMRALKQIAGAMIMPRFPQIFFFLGESGSGKSTFVKLFYRLIGGAKVAGFVQPKDMHGFQLEGLIHKTINIHTDVDEHERVSDSFFKASGDRIPIQINRKGRKVVQSLLPAVHVFCANNLPPTQVKNQNVYNRRMTVIRIDKVVQKVIDQFEDLVFEESTQALVEFALEGLRDIIKSGGFYFKPESSKQQTKDWQAQGSDALTEYLDDMAHGELSGFRIVKGASVGRTELFNSFSTWATTQGHRDIPLKAAKFYRELGARGFRLKAVNGTRMIEGFATMVESKAAPNSDKF